MSLEDKDDPVTKTVAQHKDEFEGCVAESVSLNGGENMVLHFLFTIRADGGVAFVELERSSSPDPDFVQCVSNVLRRIRFPYPNDRKSHRVEYFLRFNHPES